MPRKPERPSPEPLADKLAVVGARAIGGAFVGGICGTVAWVVIPRSLKAANDVAWLIIPFAVFAVALASVIGGDRFWDSKLFDD